METCEIMINMIIGLLTGMISGVLSGVLVTKHYRKKDEKEQEKKLHEQAIALAVDFFEDLQMEISRAKEKRNGDFSKILNILERKQRYLSGLRKGSYAIDVNVYDDIMKKIMNIELNLKNDTLDFEKASKEIQNLFLSAFSILR